MRQSRIKLEGERTVYHCMSKVVGGEFLLGEREKEVLRKQMWSVAKFCGVEILTYCLMSNHFHVLVRTPDDDEIDGLADEELLKRAGSIYSIDKVEFFAEMFSSEDKDVRRRYRASLKARMGDVSQFMKELKQRFSIWYNRSRERRRTGTLWAERFKSVLVEDDAFALSMVAAYIDLNPARARIVQDSCNYRFCGYGEAMGGAQRARRALAGLYGRRQSWQKTIEQYRVVVYGKGFAAQFSDTERAVDPVKAKEILNTGGKVSVEEALRCRVRYFTDGAVLGSREFVQRYFEAHRSDFGAKRRDGPRAMKGSEWGGLTSIRDLRCEVFG